MQRQLDREEGEVGTDKKKQNIEKQIERDSQLERRRRQAQIDVYNKKQQIDRDIVRQRGGGGRYRQMYTS